MLQDVLYNFSNLTRHIVPGAFYAFSLSSIFMFAFPVIWAYFSAKKGRECIYGKIETRKKQLCV